MRKQLRISLLFLFTCYSCTLALGQNKTVQNQNTTTEEQPASLTPADTRIPKNSKVFIAPMDGFEIYLAAAFRKKEVPLIIVTEPDYADFAISGTHEKKNAGWAKTIFLGDARSSASASEDSVIGLLQTY